MRTVSGPTDHVVVVGAGLAGLACALHLVGAGRAVTVLEREAVPGGRAGRLSLGGYEFDTGPTVLTMPELIEEALAAVDEPLSAWLDLTPVDPAYRAQFADGTSLDVVTQTARMAGEISRLAGPREADGYLRFVEYARRMWLLQRRDFIDRNLDAPTDLVTANLLRLLAAGGFRRMSTKVGQFFRDPRLRRVFSFQAMYAGLAPRDALALYTVIAYLDSVAGVWFPRGGIHAVPRALAGAAEKHGVRLRYDTAVASVAVRDGRATGVVTTEGEFVPADVVVLNPDLPVAYRDLLPGGPGGGSRPAGRSTGLSLADRLSFAGRRSRPGRLDRLRYSPSAVVLHLGADRRYPDAAHHNIHFGRAWDATFDEIIHRGRLMSDPSLLVTNPTRADPALAPSGREVYYVLAPVPNLVAGPLDWDGSVGPRYQEQLLATLERRGYSGLSGGVEVSRLVTPADWARQGMAAGTPFAAAHTLFQTGPFRPPNLHPGLGNVVFVGSGTIPGVGVPMVLISGKLGAQRITGADR